MIKEKEEEDEVFDEVEDDEENGDKAGVTWNNITTSASNHDYSKSISDEFKYIKSYRDVEIDETMFKYKFKYHIDLIFTLDIYDINNLFFKLAVLLQDYVCERLDSLDCIIARDKENNFIKIELVKKFTSIELNNKITIDIKTISMIQIENFKIIFKNLLDILFSFYPGIYYLKQVSLTNL